MVEAISLGNSQAIQNVGPDEKSPDTVPIKRIGAVRVGTGNDVAALEALDRGLQNQKEAPVDRLGGILQRLWDKAKNHRELSNIDDELLESLLTAEGEYSDAQKRTLEDQNEPEVFEPITSDIIRNARSWIEDMLNLPNGNIYSIDSTPIPDLPDDVVKRITATVLKKAMEHVQATGIAPAPEEMYEMAAALRDEVEKHIQNEADDRASRMNTVIEDQYAEGEYWDAFLALVSDICTFPTAWMKGPVIYNDEELTWTYDENGPVPKVGKVLKPKWYAPSPLDMFPSAQTSKIGEGHLFERMRFDPSALSLFREVPGFDADAIDQVLDRFAAQGHVEMTYQEQVRAELEKRDGTLMDFEGVIEVVEFTGKLQGKELKQKGFTKKLDDNSYYPIIAWLCIGQCIMARLNTSPLGEWNYSAASYENRPGSIWGKGIPQVIRTDQKDVNGYRRAASRNAGEASGPQTMVDISQLAEGQDVSSSYPGKVWQTTGVTPGAGKAAAEPVKHFQPRPIFHLLEKQIQDKKKVADMRAGIPPYAYGSDNNRGAADTVGGLSILMNNAAKGLRSILRHLDAGVIRPDATRTWLFNMLYHEDQSIKGDIKITARGALGQVVKESMFLRRQDFLKMTANPVDAEIIGLEGRRKQLEEQEETLDFPKNSIIPTAEDMESRLKEKIQAPPEAAAAGAPGAGGVPPDVVPAGAPPPQEA